MLCDIFLVSLAVSSARACPRFLKLFQFQIKAFQDFKMLSPGQNKSSLAYQGIKAKTSQSYTGKTFGCRANDSIIKSSLIFTVTNPLHIVLSKTSNTTHYITYPSFEFFNDGSLIKVM